MLTALVVRLGLLAAALATGTSSDTQKPVAIVIVAGLISRLFIGFFVDPVLYQMVARIRPQLIARIGSALAEIP